jgi:GAF domain-containing protein
VSTNTWWGASAGGQVGRRRSRSLRAKVAGLVVDGRPWSGLDAVCRVAGDEIGAEGVTLSCRQPWGLEEPIVATSRWAMNVASAQHIVGEGPTFLATRSSALAAVPDVLAETRRWPGFVDAMAGFGVRAVFAVPARHDERLQGVLTLYRRHDQDWDSATTADAFALAGIAATQLARLAVAGSGSRDWPASRHESVRAAAQLLAAKRRITIDDALTLLRARAFASGRPLPAVALDVLVRNSAE